MTVPTVPISDGFMEAPDTDSWASDLLIAKDSRFFHVGSQSLEIPGPSGFTAVSQSCLLPGEYMKVRFAIKSSSSMTVQVKSGSTILKEITATTSWVEHSVDTFLADSDDLSWLPAGASGTVYLDAVEVWVDPRRTERAVSHIASRFSPGTGNGAVSLEDLVTALTSPAENIDQTLNAMLNRRGLDGAIGTWLDLIGRIIGVGRFKKEYDNDVLFEFGDTYALAYSTLIGTDTNHSSPVNADSISASRFVATRDGLPDKIRVYSSSAGDIKFAVYEDGHSGGVGSRIVYDDTPYSCAGSQWNEFTLPEFDVVDGATYWIAVISDTLGTTVRGGTGTIYGASATFSTFSWPASGSAWSLISSTECSFAVQADGFVPDSYRGFANTAQTTGGRLYGVNGAILPSGDLIDDPDYISLLRAKASVSFQPSSIKSCVDFVYDAFGVESWVSIDEYSDWTLYLSDPISVAQRRYLRDYAPVPAGSKFSIGNWPVS